MKRRAFITLFGGAAAAWPLAAHAQQSERVRRIGVLMGTSENDPESQKRVTALQKGLELLGWTAGRNVTIDWRFGPGDRERMRSYAIELLAAMPDVVVVSTTPALLAMRQANRTTPIVFAQVADPVGNGFVSSLSHPGGNITGFASTEDATSGKWLELLNELNPAISRILVVSDPSDPSSENRMRAIEFVAISRTVQVSKAQVPSAAEIVRAIDAFASEPNGGVIVLPSPSLAALREHIIATAARHRLPTISAYRFFPASGGLISYGNDPTDNHAQAAYYVDRILKGAKPADLPVQNPTKYELIINLKTAKALGLTVPPTLLARADEVIE